MRLPRHATASARGCASFTVHILPFSNTRLAEGCAPAMRTPAKRSIVESPTRNPDILRLYRMEASNEAQVLQTMAASPRWCSPPPSRAAPSAQRIAAIMSRPEYVHARFGMEFRRARCG